MKTVRELNSRWYWRLIKVFYFLILLGILLGSLWLSYDNLQIYNPEKIRDIEVKYNDIIQKINFLNSNFAGKPIKRDEIIEKKLANKDIVLLLALWTHNGKWDLWFYESTSTGDSKKCTEEIEKYKSWEITTIDWSYCWVSMYKSILSKISSIPADWKNSNFYTEELYETLNSWRIYRDYFGLRQYLTIFAYWIWILFVLWAITLLIRWISYYIILWRFNPEK